MSYHRVLAPSLCVLTLMLGTPASAFEPGNVECIAPSNPGGGWDFTCRQVGKILYDLDKVSSPVQVTNMPGGDGGVAYSYMVSKRSDDPNLLAAASSATVSRLALDQYGGLNADDVRWVAALGADFGAISVPADSEYQTLQDLVDALKAAPSSVAFAGGSAVGGYDHLKVLLMAKSVGVAPKDVKYVAYVGGGEAMTSLLGGHVDALSGDLSEVEGQLEAGDVRVLAVMAPERVPNHPDIPTVQEQLGEEVIGANWRGFYMPAGASDDAYETWQALLHDLYDSEEWKEAAKSYSLAPFWNSGDEFAQFVKNDIALQRELSKEAGLIE